VKDESYLYFIKIFLMFLPHGAGRNFVDYHETLFIRQIHQLFRVRVVGCPEGIRPSPLHQIEIFNQSDVIQAPSTDLLRNN